VQHVFVALQRALCGHLDRVDLVDATEALKHSALGQPSGKPAKSFIQVSAHDGAAQGAQGMLHQALDLFVTQGVL